jgi:hypothetical protein
MRKRVARIADASSKSEKIKKFSGRTESDERTREETLSAGRVLWFGRGTHCGIINAGTERYRQIAVELK